MATLCRCTRVCNGFDCLSYQIFRSNRPFRTDQEYQGRLVVKTLGLHSMDSNGRKGTFLHKGIVGFLQLASVNN